MAQRTVLWFWSVISLFSSSSVARGQRAAQLAAAQSNVPATRPHTLVLYVYSDSDSEYIHNLAYFVTHGMAAGDGCDYRIIVQEKGDNPNTASLPSLPTNARYLHHANECFDWGTFGWALKGGYVSTKGYEFIIFMNSSVRGPFLPAYWPASVHWTKILTSKIDSKIKVVGPTINCEGVEHDGSGSGPPRRNPHVQSYVFATDQEGLRVLKAKGNVFSCHTSMADTIYHSEIGSSLAILQAGYSIDSLMLKYAHVDWTDEKNWGCNARRNPTSRYDLDGTNLQPLEVLFIKVRHYMIDEGWESQAAALTYERWLASQTDVTRNLVLSRNLSIKSGSILRMLLRGSSCFDFGIYNHQGTGAAHNSHARRAAWLDFAVKGQFALRNQRFSCPDHLLDEQKAHVILRRVLQGI